MQLQQQRSLTRKWRKTKVCDCAFKWGKWKYVIVSSSEENESMWLCLQVRKMKVCDCAFKGDENFWSYNFEIGIDRTPSEYRYYDAIHLLQNRYKTNACKVFINMVQLDLIESSLKTRKEMTIWRNFDQKEEMLAIILANSRKGKNTFTVPPTNAGTGKRCFRARFYGLILLFPVSVFYSNSIRTRFLHVQWLWLTFCVSYPWFLSNFE